MARRNVRLSATSSGVAVGQTVQTVPLGSTWENVLVKGNEVGTDLRQD